MDDARAREALRRALLVQAWLRRRGPDVLFISVLVYLPYLFFWRILTTSPLDRMTLAEGDFLNVLYPLKLFAARSWAAGIVPLWNPFTNGGQPGLADTQTTALYPVFLLNLLFGGLPYGIAQLEREVVWHFVLAGVFTYLFARQVLPHRLGAFVAALVFTFGGYLTGFPPSQVSVLETAIWLPLILLFLELGLQRYSWQRTGWFLLAGGALAVCLTAGHPQTQLLIFYASIAFAMFRLFQRQAASLGELPRSLVQVGVYVAVGFALAAPQLLSTLEFIGLSSRAHLGYSEAAHGFVWRELIGLVIPDYFGGNPLYVGIAPLALAALAVALGRGAQRLFWIALGLAALVLSLGGSTFLYSVFYLGLYGFDQVRGQERASILIALSLAMLAGQGVVLLVMLPERLRELLPRFAQQLGRAVLAALVFTAVAYVGWVASGPYKAGNPFEGLAAYGNYISLLATLTWAIVATRQRRQLSAGWLHLALPVLIIFDLFSVNWQDNLHAVPKAGHFPITSIVERVWQDDSEAFRVHGAGLAGDGNGGIVYELQDTIGNTPFEISQHYLMGNNLEELRNWYLWNVKYVIAKRELDTSRGLRLVQQEGDVRLYQTDDAQRLPRVQLVHSAVVVGSEEEAWRRSGDGSVNLREAAVLQADLATPLAAPTGQEGVKLSVLTADRIEADVTASAEALVVFSEAWYSGWRALVDGKDAPLYRANYALRAVPVSAGTHQVALEYDPTSFTLGAALSGLALLGCLAFAAYLWHDSRGSAARFSQRR